jgi:hypothetical protein
MDEFKKLLPIDDAKYSDLINEHGLNGYKLRHGMSGNVVLVDLVDGSIIKHLNGGTKNEIIVELNGYVKT